jgi:PKD repeat protein
VFSVVGSASAGQTVTFTIKATGAATYQLGFDDGQVASGSLASGTVTVNHAYLAAGTYLPVVIVIGPTGSDSASATINVK